MKLKLIIGALCVVNVLSGMSREITGYPDTTEQRTISLFNESKRWHVPLSVVKRIPLVQSLNISEKESYLPRAISTAQMKQFIPILKIYAESKDLEFNNTGRWGSFLTKKNCSQLYQIAHVADVLGMDAVLEESCKHIADRITDPQEIAACLRRGRYEFPIDSVGTQLAVPVQYIIATHMQPEDFKLNLMQMGSKKLQGHSGCVTSAAFNRTGDKIVTASDDDTARIWNAQTGELEHTLRGHRRQVNSAVFNSAGEKIVTASADGTARIWNAQTGALEHTLPGYIYIVKSAVFNRAGDKIMIASGETPRVWNAQSGVFEYALKGHMEKVTSAVFNSAGDKIVTASENGIVRIWDAQTGMCQRTLWGSTSIATSAVFNKAGDKIVTAFDDGTAQIWNTQTGALEHALQDHTRSVTSAVFNRAGDKIVTASADGSAYIWNAQTGALEHDLQGHNATVTSAMFNRAGGKIVTASYDGTARLWNAQTGKLEHILQDHAGWVTSAVFNRAGDKIVTTARDGTARIWHLWPLTMSLLLPEQMALLHVLLENGELPEITPAMREIAAQMPILVREKLLAAYPVLGKNSRTKQI